MPDLLTELDEIAEDGEYRHVTDTARAAAAEIRTLRRRLAVVEGVAECMNALASALDAKAVPYFDHAAEKRLYPAFARELREFAAGLLPKED